MVESIHWVRRVLQLLRQQPQPSCQIILRCCPREPEPLTVKSFHLAHDPKHLVRNLLLAVTVLPCLLRMSGVVVTHTRDSLLNASQRAVHLLHTLLACLHPGVQTTITDYLL